MSAFIPEILAQAIMPKEILAEASSLHLCLHLNPLWVQVAVAEASGNRVLWSHSFQIEPSQSNDWTNVLRFVADRNWSESVFRKCTLTYDTANFTLVPSAFFEAEKTTALLEFQTGQKHEQITSLSIGELNAEFLYATETKFQILMQHFPNARIFPTAFLFAQYARIHSNKDENCIHSFVTPSALLLSVFKIKQLQMLNHFDVQGAEDVLYFIANAATQFGIEMEHATIKLYQHQQNTATPSLLKNYCNNVDVVLNNSSHNQPIIIQMHLTCA